MITAYCLCLLLSLPLVLPLIYIVSVVKKLYEEMLHEEKRKKLRVIQYRLGSNIKALKDFGTLLKRSISRDTRSV